MNYTKATGEKSTVKLTMDFSEEEWKTAISSAYVKTRGKYSVPGFRKGKVPKPVLENFYGKSIFYEEALNILFQENYYTVIEKEKENFTVVGEPSLDVGEFKEGEGVSLIALVPVKPDVEIEKYTGLKIRKYVYNVSNEDVEKEMKKLAESDAKTAEVTDRACKNGDTVNIDFSGSVDGEKFAGGTAEEYDLVLGSGAFIPGFESQVEGMKLGESRDITVKFPEDYQAENLRGKDAVFAVKLNKITEKQLPELTDEYVKKHANCDTVEDYRKKTREKLEKNAQNRGRDETENSIVEEINKYAKCEMPDAMVESEIDRMVQEFSYRLMYQGLKLEDYLKYMGQDMAQFRSQFRSQATPRVLSQLVIDKIVRTEGIKAEDSEIEEKLSEQAKSVEKTLEEYKKSVDPRQIEYISNDIVITKLFKFLEDNNDMYVEDKEKTEEKAAKAKKPAAKKTAAKKTTDENKD